MRTLHEILDEASGEEVDQLRQIVLSAEKLSTDGDIHILDGPDLGLEIRKFGGNTFANVFRGAEGPPYSEIAKDVADKVKANYDPGASTRDLESAVHSKVLGEAWKKMDEAERQALIAECGLTGQVAANASAAAIQAVFRAGGFASYKLLVIVVNAVVRQLIAMGLVASGLSLATNAMLTRTAALVVGPIGWAVTALITAIQIAGPSYKVTVPSVIYVGYLRRKQEALQCVKCEAIYDPSHKFCSACGEKLPIALRAWCSPRLVAHDVPVLEP